MATIPTREPIEIAAGDTVAFIKTLPDYPASQGWSLKYEIRGGSQLIEFASTVSGGSHALTVTAATTALWLPADTYTLSGYALKGAERHQIYLGQLTILPNVPAMAGDEPTKTFAQKMVEQYEATLPKIARSNLTGSQAGESRFTYEEQKNIRAEHGYWLSVRRNEIAKERAQAGLPTGNKIRPFFRVKAPGPVVGRVFIGGYNGW